MVYNRLEDILLHCMLYWSGGPLYEACPFKSKKSMSEKVRKLGNKAYIQVTCPHCDSSDVYEREGVEHGHSYLEDIYGEEYECSFCENEMIISDYHMYGWVRN